MSALACTWVGEFLITDRDVAEPVLRAAQVEVDDVGECAPPILANLGRREERKVERVEHVARVHFRVDVARDRKVKRAAHGGQPPVDRDFALPVSLSLDDGGRADRQCRNRRQRQCLPSASLDHLPSP
jgi:hypothetical protein